MTETQNEDALARFVNAQATRLWEGYRADRSEAVAELARLRRVVPTKRDLDPDVWALFAKGDGFPAPLLGSTDAPSASELAAGATLSLFAIHQQSRREDAMHRRGREHRLGRAASTLRPQTDSVGVERRMQALSRASDVVQVLDHLRGLVTLLRTFRVPLDYAQLALDLRRVQSADGRRAVRTHWSRDFHRVVTPPTSPPDDPDPEASTTLTSGDPA